jgi:hypothetical protein
VTQTKAGLKEGVHDNSYNAKVRLFLFTLLILLNIQRGDSWGAKAAQDLGKVQGKSFRHEKTKKKRGSYAGGEIDTGIHSHKFSDDSD